MTTKWTGSDTRISGLARAARPAPIQRISRPRPGQSCPQQKPGLMYAENDQNVLGEPLTIRMVFEMFGCSAWTIRQKYIPDGLPHLRSGPAGKLIFFRNQVVRWILQQQEQTRKGGR